MPVRLRYVFLFILLVVPAAANSMAADAPGENSIVVVTDFTYHRGDTDSVPKAKALAQFGAKYKAVQLAAKYLTHKGLLEHYEKKQNEIFCLA